MKPLAIGDIVHYVARTRDSGGIWRNVCRAAIVTETPAAVDRTALTLAILGHSVTGDVFYDTATYLAAGTQVGVWHHRADCTPDDGIKLAMQHIESYTISLDGWPDTTNPFEVTYNAEADGTAYWVANQGDGETEPMYQGTGPTRRAAILALIRDYLDHQIQQASLSPADRDTPTFGDVQEFLSGEPADPDAVEVEPESRCPAETMDDDDSLQCVLPANHARHQYGDTPRPERFTSQSRAHVRRETYSNNNGIVGVRLTDTKTGRVGSGETEAEARAALERNQPNDSGV